MSMYSFHDSMVAHLLHSANVINSNNKQINNNNNK